MTKAAGEKLSKARAIIKQRAPYFATSVLSFIPHEIENKNTMGLTKGLVLLYDPAWIVKIPEEEVAAALIHEVMHHLQDHLPRIEVLPDHQLGNAAADLAINPQIRTSGWKLPHGIFPEKYGLPDGQTLETYYDLLSKKPPPQKGKPKQQNQQQEKEQSQDQSCEDESKEQQANGPKSQQQKLGGRSIPQQSKNGKAGKGTPSPSQLEQPSNGKGTNGQQPQQSAPEDANGIGSGHCGGIAGNPIDKELEDQVDAEIGRDPAERKIIAKKTLEAVKKHASQFGRGSIPGGLLEAIQVSEEKAMINWRKEMRAFAMKATGRVEAGGMDFSLARPAKRSYARGFPRPGLVQRVPEVAFIIDTSGSMGDRQILDSIREGVGIFRSLGLDMAWLIQADTHITTAPKRVRIRDLMGEVKIYGRGGTHFDPALRELMNLKPKPDIAVYFTDGDGLATFKPKNIEVIWCIINSYYNKKPVDWGHAVFVPREK